MSADEEREALIARAQYFVDCKYTTHADERQRSMGLAYVEAERQDLAREIANFAASAIAALAPPKGNAEGMKVRELVWEEAIHGGWCALGAAGLYHVHVGYRDETRFYFFTNPFDHEPNDFCSEKAAKAAAQADYETRILSVLTPSPISAPLVDWEGYPVDEKAMRELMHKPTEALRVAREEIVIAIAFLGRDAGTNRIDRTIRGLIDRLVKADQQAQVALGLSTQPTTQPEGDGK